MLRRALTKIALWSRYHQATQQPRSTFNSTRPKGSESRDQEPLYHEGPLEATAPYRRCYIFLNALDQPSKFPKVFQTPISRELVKRSMEWGSGVSVNFLWMEHFANERASAKQPATVYSHLAGRLDIPDVSLENMDDIEQQILHHLDSPLTKPTSKNVDVYVCTHAARDCRCGERGQQVYDALLRAVQHERHQDPSCFANDIRIGAVGHLGGHQYAANVLIFPHGEWYVCCFVVLQSLTSLKVGVRKTRRCSLDCWKTHQRPQGSGCSSTKRDRKAVFDGSLER